MCWKYDCGKRTSERIFWGVSAVADVIASGPGLMHTKYSMPKGGGQLLPRQAAGRLLDDAQNRRLTVVTAPAGCGKTSAVRGWLASSPLPAAWLSLDLADNDPLAFWRGVCVALDVVAPGIVGDTDYVFKAPELFRAKLHLGLMVDALLREGNHFLLVLDDLHLITNPDIYEGLNYLIAHMPETMHVILISRVKPRLNLESLAMKEELIRIGPVELRFQKEEIARFYKARGYLLQTDELDRIERYTEGWAAALVAVALSIQDERSRSSVISSFGGSTRHIENYLAEDVFGAWTPPQQDFMEKAVVLEKLCGPLCTAVTDYDGGSMLRELYEQNCFLVALDTEGVWFRYHPLFSDFLLKRLKERDAASIQSLQARAASWFQDNGYAAEAIECYLKGRLYAKAAALIEIHGSPLVRRGEYFRVLSWIDRLPESVAQNSVMLQLIKTAYYSSEESFGKAWTCLGGAEALIRNQTPLPRRLYGIYLMTKANLFFRQGDIGKTQPLLREAAEYGAADVADGTYMDFNLYEISAYRAPLYPFLKALGRSPQLFHSVTGNYRSIINKGPGYAPLIAGELLYESGEIEAALPKLLAAMDEAVSAGCPGALVPAMVTMAKIRRFKGDIEGAFQMLEECKKRLYPMQRPHWGYILRAFKARLYIEANDRENLDKWLSENRLSLFQDDIRIHEYELIVLARLYIHRKRYDDAKLLLNRLAGFAEGLKRSHSIVEILNLLAITAHNELESEAASGYLEKALSIGEAEGYVRSFVDELAPMAAILTVYVSDTGKTDRLLPYARKLLALTNEAVRCSMVPTTPELLGLLTPTERKVLQLLVNAYTNKEISNELGISLRTIKAHTGSIYRKLNVQNRAQCMKKASGTIVRER